jgi:hypothetical protein
VREQPWWKPLRGRLLNERDSDLLAVAPIGQQLGKVASLDLPERVGQTIIATLADDWDATKIRRAFAVPRTALLEVFRLKRQNNRCILASFMPPIALEKLATSPQWEVRYLVALHDQTRLETRQRLCQDGNRYVRAMARAKAGMLGESAW